MLKRYETKRILALVVAFGNERILKDTLSAVCPQLASGDELWVVDNSASLSPKDATKFAACPLQVLRGGGNLGFCKGNNVGLEAGKWRDFKYVLLLNPDLVLPDGWIDRAITRMEGFESNRIGVLSGPLLKYDFASGRPTGAVDSLGIARSRLSGLWYDAGSGEPYEKFESELADEIDVAAVCGALMLIPTQVVSEVIDGHQLFDERFFAYKEDIDLSLRIRNAGWRLVLAKSLSAYHGRGWAATRASVPFKLRALSARNDVILNIKHRSPYVCLSLLKLLYVFTIERLLAKRKQPARSRA